jgi:hypothetical protein
MIWLFLVYFLPFILVVAGQTLHDYKAYGKFDITIGLMGGYIPILNWLVLYDVVNELLELHRNGKL